MKSATAAAVKPTQVATLFAGGYSADAARIRIAGLTYALIVAPKAEGQFEAKWNKNQKLVDGASSFFDGRANTDAMAAAGSPIAMKVRALTIGGFNDWYIPSRDEMEIIYRSFKPSNDENYCWRGDNPSSVPPGYAYSRNDPAQTAIEEFRAGGVEAFDLAAYWTSTQGAGDDGYAWCQFFSYGGQGSYREDDELLARAVRRILI